jgi:hypothetical protein
MYINNMKYDIIHAIEKLYPNVECIITENTYESLKWFNSNISKPSKEELEECILQLNIVEPMRLLRIERNKRLDECRWIIEKALTTDVPIPQDWKDYMQLLRDLPSVSNPQLDRNGDLDMNSVNWPIKPIS